MSTKHALSASLLLAISILSSSAAWSSSHALHAGDRVPVFVTPSSSSVTAGSSLNWTVTMDGTCLTNTVVSLSSNDSALTVPTSVTVLAGNSSATFTSSTDPNTGSITVVTVTGAANGGSAYGSVTVRPRRP